MNISISELLTVTDLPKSLSSVNVITVTCRLHSISTSRSDTSYAGLKQGALVAAGEALNTTTKIQPKVGSNFLTYTLKFFHIPGWTLSLNRTGVTCVGDQVEICVCSQKETKKTLYTCKSFLFLQDLKNSDDAKDLSTIFIYRQRSLIAGLEFTHL